MGLDIYFNVVNREAYNTVKELKNKHIHYDVYEIGYFRKFWGLLNKLEYGDEQYAKNVEVTESKVDELLEFTKIVLCECFEHIRKNTYWLNSHLKPSDFRSQIDSNFIEYLDVGIFEKCTRICEKHFKTDDNGIFSKTFDLYNMLIKIKKEVNFEEDILFVNADW